MVSKGTVASKSIMKRPFKYVKAIFFGSLISSPVESLMIVVLKCRIISRAKTTSIIWFTITFGVSSNISGSKAMSIGMLKLFQTEMIKMRISHLILKRLFIRIIYFLRKLFSTRLVSYPISPFLRLLSEKSCLSAGSLSMF